MSGRNYHEHQVWANGRLYMVAPYTYFTDLDWRMVEKMLENGEDSYNTKRKSARLINNRTLCEIKSGDVVSKADVRKL